MPAPFGVQIERAQEAALGVEDRLAVAGNVHDTLGLHPQLQVADVRELVAQAADAGHQVL